MCRKKALLTPIADHALCNPRYQRGGQSNLVKKKLGLRINQCNCHSQGRRRRCDFALWLGPKTGPAISTSKTQRGLVVPFATLSRVTTFENDVFNFKAWKSGHNGRRCDGNASSHGQRGDGKSLAWQIHSDRCAGGWRTYRAACSITQKYHQCALPLHSLSLGGKNFYERFLVCLWECQRPWKTSYFEQCAHPVNACAQFMSCHWRWHPVLASLCRYHWDSCFVQLTKRRSRNSHGTPKGRRYSLCATSAWDPRYSPAHDDTTGMKFPTNLWNSVRISVWMLVCLRRLQQQSWFVADTTQLLYLAAFWNGVRKKSSLHKVLFAYYSRSPTICMLWDRSASLWDIYS